MRYESLLPALGKALRLPRLAPDALGVVRLTFDGRFEVVLTPAANGTLVSLQGTVSTTPCQVRQLERLLAANVAGLGAGGAFFAETEERQLVLSHSLPLAQLSFAEFANALQCFVNHLGYWRERLLSAAGGGTRDATPLEFRKAA